MAYLAQGDSAPDISVVLPVYQEEDCIEPVIRRIVDILGPDPATFEIVAVDDGSRDGTFGKLVSLQRELSECMRVAHHTTNKGNGASVRTGIRLARGEIVVTMDADGQHDPADIPRLLGCIPPYDMVVGSRTSTYQGAWYRNLANRIYNKLASWLTNTEILDLTSGYRAVRRQAIVHFLPLFPAGFSSPTTATMCLLKAGYSVRFIPIDVGKRTGGKSKINIFRDGSRFILIILRIITLYDPMRVFLPAALMMLLAGVVGMVWGSMAEGRLVVPGSAVVAFISAVFILLLGLVSSQVSTTLISYYGDEYVEVREQSQPASKKS